METKNSMLRVVKQSDLTRLGTLNMDGERPIESIVGQDLLIFKTLGKAEGTFNKQQICPLLPNQGWG